MQHSAVSTDDFGSCMAIPSLSVQAFDLNPRDATLFEEVYTYLHSIGHVEKAIGVKSSHEEALRLTSSASFRRKGGKAAQRSGDGDDTTSDKGSLQSTPQVPSQRSAQVAASPDSGSGSGAPVAAPSTSNVTPARVRAPAARGQWGKPSPTVAAPATPIVTPSSDSTSTPGKPS